MSLIIANPVGVASGSPSTSIFGNDFVFTEELSVTTSTLTTFQEKLSLSSGNVVAGTYRIGWSFQWNHNSTADDFEGRVQLDNSADLEYIQLEMKDANSNNGTIGPNPGPFSTTGSDQQSSTSGFKYVVLTPGIHIIDIDFRSNNPARASSIWNAKLEFWRVG